jgi:hypothetical protein
MVRLRVGAYLCPASKDLTPQVPRAIGSLPDFDLPAKNGVRLGLGRFTHCLGAGLAATVANLSIRGKSLMTSLAENKAIAGRWFDAF